MSRSFEKLVPSLKLCMEIPDGCFGDSVFVWQMQNDETWWEVVLRNEMTGEPHYPAPTLEEIMDGLHDRYPSATVQGYTHWATCISDGSMSKITPMVQTVSENCADAMIYLWLHFKKEAEK